VLHINHFTADEEARGLHLKRAPKPPRIRSKGKTMTPEQEAAWHAHHERLANDRHARRLVGMPTKFWDQPASKAKNPTLPMGQGWKAVE
jgi:hypothetical protein